MHELLDKAHRLDLALYTAIAETDTPVLDRFMRTLSPLADYSKLSLTSAGILALTGRRGRRAALSGLASLAVAATSVNVAVKLMTRRERPDREAQGVPEARFVRMPTSTSFPSGHSAAAFAFATGVGSVWPGAGVPLVGLAGLVAYSRVHTGVHYPGDVMAGSLMGVGFSLLTIRAVRKWVASGPGVGDDASGVVEVLRQHLRAPDQGHEVRVAAPAGH
jgi:membrane-associated phospholipid phosphatase